MKKILVKLDRVTREISLMLIPVYNQPISFTGKLNYSVDKFRQNLKSFTSNEEDKS